MLLSFELSHLNSFIEYFLINKLQMSFIILLLVTLLTIVAMFIFGVRKYRSTVSQHHTVGGPAKVKYRFRKRDKVIFYGRRMLRRVRSFTRNTMNGGPLGLTRRKSAQRLMMSKIRKLLNRRDSCLPQLKSKTPPTRFLEADWPDFEMSNPHLPPEIFYLLRSVRVLGHLEKPFFLELCKFMETVKVKAAQYLFKVGDDDNCIYVVQSGIVEVYITDKDGERRLVKVVRTGDSIHSLLSVLDVLTGHSAPFKTVSAKAMVDSIILKLPVLAFTSMFERYNESLVRIVQIIMIRLQRVTFMAMHNYLGLTNELITSEPQQDISSLYINALHRRSASAASPSKLVASSAGSGMNEISSVYGTMTETAMLEEDCKKMTDFDVFPRWRVGSDKLADEELDMEFPVLRKLSDETRRGTSKRNVHDDALHCMSDECILSLAKKDLANLFKLKNPRLFDGRTVLQHVKSGTYLCRQGDQDASLFFVVKGGILATQQSVVEDKQVRVFSVLPGEMAGMLAVLSGEPSLFSLRAKPDLTIVSISKGDFCCMLREEPLIILQVSCMAVRGMSPFVRQIDFALDWQMIEAGKALFRQSDATDSVYIVLTGRLRSVIMFPDGRKEMVREFGRGELVGIVEVLTHTERATTCMAIRDTEVANIPEELLSLIKLKYPQVVTRLIHLLGQRILGNLQNRNSVVLDQGMKISGGGAGASSTVGNQALVTNLSTVAVVPASEAVPIENFSLELQHSLNAIGSTLRLTSRIIRQQFGPAALDYVNEFRLVSWLNHQEDTQRMILLQCDAAITRWTRHCIRQADAILVVAVADHGPGVGTIEKDIENIAARAQKELVLLHKEAADTPTGTADWLNARGWCSSFHHLRCNKRIFSRKSQEKMLQIYQKLFESGPDRMSDFSRLARFLTGTSIGLVLGGGGARGLAHVGMITAIQEAGIPIDMVGGTSIGSFIGALLAEERHSTGINTRAKDWSMKMASIWKKLVDLTYPHTSIFTGGFLNDMIKSAFPSRQIEDLWIPYFCVTTDITNSSTRVHTSGSVWRYVRASMSLSGYLPPMCDPVDGHLLLDGGYVDNLPADTMRTMGARTILAVDVGSQDETNLTNYGDQLSGWWLLWNHWKPWRTGIKVLDMTEIQQRLAYVSCVRQLEAVKNSDWCEYIRPSIDRYTTLQFSAYDEIMGVGYNHGTTLFSGWKKGGLIDNLFKESAIAMVAQPQKQVLRQTAASFTDLAELVSRIDRPQSQFYLADTDSESNTHHHRSSPGFADGDDDDDEYLTNDSSDEDMFRYDVIAEEQSDALEDDECCLDYGVDTGNAGSTDLNLGTIAGNESDLICGVVDNEKVVERHISPIVGDAHSA